MRSTKLAFFAIFISSLATATVIASEPSKSDVMQAVQKQSDLSINRRQPSPTESTRQRDVQLASSLERISSNPNTFDSPSTYSKPKLASTPSPSVQQQPVAENTAIGRSIYDANPFFVAAPSRPTPLQMYMNCDPYTCPNIWDGHSAELAAELARKCSPTGCGCQPCGGSNCGQSGCGCGLKSQLYSTPCTTCGGKCARLNRYQPTQSDCGCGKAITSEATEPGCSAGCGCK